MCPQEEDKRKRAMSWLLPQVSSSTRMSSLPSILSPAHYPCFQEKNISSTDFVVAENLFQTLIELFIKPNVGFYFNSECLS